MSLQISAEKIDLKDKERWERLLSLSSFYSYRQSLDYIYSGQSDRKATETFIFEKNGADIAGVHYTLISSVFGIIRSSDISSGWVFTGDPDSETISFLLGHFHKWSVKHKASFSRINTWLPSLIKNKKTASSELIESKISESGFNVISKGRNTYWLDLSLTEQELLNRMRRKTRYDVRRGNMGGLTIEFVQCPDKYYVDYFWRLYNEMGSRKKISILKEEKFKENIRILLESGLAILFIALYKNVIVNISLASCTGIASYMYGAIYPGCKNIEGCPPPGHFAQWEMIRKMKSKGIKIYDMGFCPGAVPYKEHVLYDIWRFKYGFGGEHVQFMPVYGKILKPLRGKLFRLLRYRK